MKDEALIRAAKAARAAFYAYKFPEPAAGLRRDGVNGLWLTIAGAVAEVLLQRPECVAVEPEPQEWR